MIWIYLQNHTRIFNAKSALLHIAPEFELMQEFLKFKNISYSACDNFTDSYEYFGAVKKEDLCNLTYPENSFNFIVCNHVLEHIEDDRKALESLYSVLSENGILIITVPINSSREETVENSTYNTRELRERHFGQHNHVRQYGMDIMERFSSAGFKAECIKSTDFFEKEVLEKSGILEDVFFVLKKIIKRILN